MTNIYIAIISICRRLLNCIRKTYNKQLLNKKTEVCYKLNKKINNTNCIVVYFRDVEILTKIRATVNVHTI